MSGSSGPRVAVVVVTHSGSGAVLDRCLASIVAADAEFGGVERGDAESDDIAPVLAAHGDARSGDVEHVDDDFDDTAHRAAAHGDVRFGEAAHGDAESGDGETRDDELCDERCVAVVVVDNSGGPTDAIVDRWGAEGVAVVTTPNAGYGAAANLGAAHASARGAEYVAVLNDDTVVAARWLAPLVAVLDADDGVGAVQSKLLLAGTEPPLVNSLGVRLDDNGAGVDIGYRTSDAAAPTEVHDVDIFTAGAVLLRRRFLDDLGGFDERIFLYYEDVDLALRGAERGWRYRCAPSSVVVHELSSTTHALGDEARHLQDRNRLRTAARFGSAPHIARAYWLSIRRLRHAPHRAHARALAGGLLLAPAMLLERVRTRRRHAIRPTGPSTRDRSRRIDRGCDDTGGVR